MMTVIVAMTKIGKYNHISHKRKKNRENKHLLRINNNVNYNLRRINRMTETSSDYQNVKSIIYNKD